MYLYQPFQFSALVNITLEDRDNHLLSKKIVSIRYFDNCEGILYTLQMYVTKVSLLEYFKFMRIELYLFISDSVCAMLRSQ